MFSLYARKVILDNLLAAHDRICKNGTAEEIRSLTSFALTVTKDADFEIGDPDQSSISLEVSTLGDFGNPIFTETFTRRLGGIGAGIG